MTDEPARHVIVHLDAVASSDLDWLCVADALNPSIVVNRALRVYRLVREYDAEIVLRQVGGPPVRVKVEPPPPLEDREGF